MKTFINSNKEFVFGTDRLQSGVSAVSVSFDGEELGAALRPVSGEETETGATVLYQDEQKTARAIAHIRKYTGIHAISQQTEVICDGAHVLTQPSSANINGICFDEKGLGHRLHDGSILVHYCVSRWQGEGQWRTVTPEDLGVYAATEHPWERPRFRFDSVSSWSSGTYSPLFMIEDKKQNETWFFEIEGGGSWFFELYGWGGLLNLNALSVKLGGADERTGFVKKLSKGESYWSKNCVYGVVKGGFEEAVRELTKYKRATTVAPNGCPLTFNDYMNCNWANERKENLLPLIDAAAELGAEIFCLDDGWQHSQGIWYPADERFGDMKLQGIFDYIKSKGMKIGVWFEFETVPLQVAEMLGADDCHLFRNDVIVAPARPIGNMRSEKLIAHLNERVDALYNMGVRFIKNDHNNTEYLGTTMYGESAGEGLEENEKAFLVFIDGLRERHPDLIIENCGSGAMRSDHGTLKHFSIQSTSDQEDYVTYTSIIGGSLALMAPEKAGIWCYPYPLHFDDREKMEIPAQQLSQYADGEQTVFNIVNGFMGAMYLSGKLHQADEYNLALLKEGVSLYKSCYGFIRESYPIFPRGMVRMFDRTYNSVGLINEENTKILLAVWNLSDGAQEFTLDIQKYGMTGAEVLYPTEKLGFSFEYKDGKLVCRFEKGRSARLLCLKR